MLHQRFMPGFDARNQMCWLCSRSYSPNSSVLRSTLPVTERAYPIVTHGIPVHPQKAGISSRVPLADVTDVIKRNRPRRLDAMSARLTFFLIPAHNNLRRTGRNPNTRVPWVRSAYVRTNCLFPLINSFALFIRPLEQRASYMFACSALNKLYPIILRHSVRPNLAYLFALIALSTRC